MRVGEIFPKVAILTPIRWSVDVHCKDIVNRARFLASRLTWPNTVRIEHVDTPMDDPLGVLDPSTPHFEKCSDARNTVLDLGLKTDAAYFLHVDVDVVDYPIDLIERLIAAVEEDAIVAPSAMFEPRSDAGTWASLHDRWFDVCSFVTLSGDHFGPTPPHHSGYSHVPDWPVEVACVGMCYLAPAWIYREPHALRYASVQDGPRMRGTMLDPGCAVEHWSICKGARDLGIKTYWLPTVTARHVDAVAYAKGIRRWRTL